MSFGARWYLARMVPLAWTVAALAGLFWLSVFVHWIALLKHRRPDLSLGKLLASGYLAWSADTYLASGAALHRRMVLSGLGFGLCVLAGIAVGALAAG